MTSGAPDSGASEPLPKKRRPSDIAIAKFKHGGVALRYAVVEGAASDASSLVVVLPTIRRDGRVKLDKPLAQQLVSPDRHVLVTAADKHLYFGPGRRALGLAALTQLVSGEMERHGVDPTDVTVVGRQLGGSIALWLASRIPVGRVIAGACPTRLAEFLRSQSVVDDEVPDGDAVSRERPERVSELTTALRAFEDDPKVATWLDRTITRDLDKVAHPLAIDLFATSQTMAVLAKLQHDLAKHPTIASILVEDGPNGRDFATFARARVVGA